jgi:predicted aminopeptidase
VTLDDWVEAPLWATRTVPISLPNTVLDKSGVVQITQLLRHTTAFATREMDDLYYRKNLENFVALVGAQQWVHQKLSDTEAQRYDEELAQRKMFYQFANEYRQKIAFLMTSAITADEKNFRIRTLLSDMQTAYEGIKPQLTSAKVYDDWITQELHYGHLWLMGMQSEYFFAFERLLEESDHNMVIFFAKALELGKLSYDERIKTLRGYQTKVERDPDVRNVFNGQ